MKFKNGQISLINIKINLLIHNDNYCMNTEKKNIRNSLKINTKLKNMLYGNEMKFNIYFNTYNILKIF